MSTPGEILHYPGSYPRLMTRALSDLLLCRMQAGKKDLNDVIHDRVEDEEFVNMITEMHGDLIRRQAYGRILRDSNTTLYDITVPLDELGRIVRSVTKPRVLHNELILNREDITSAIENIPSVKSDAEDIWRIFREYNTRVLKEYQAIKEVVKSEFEEMGKKKGETGIQHYKWLRKWFFREGVTDPPKELNKITMGVFFLEKHVGGVNNDLLRVLKKAEHELEINGFLNSNDASLSKAFSFVPRPQNSKRRISAHALGRAIDIDANKNPHLQGRTADSIDKILDWMEARGNPTTARIKKDFNEFKGLSVDVITEAKDLHNKMIDISLSIQSFLDEYLEDWLAQRSKGRPDEKNAYALIEELLKSFKAVTINNKRVIKIKKKNFKKVKEIQNRGFWSIPLRLYIELFKAGESLSIKIRSGLQYKTAKDNMHIELMPDLPKGTIPKCITSKRRRRRKRR